MRTTIDIPDELYRSLKARAALSGVPVREVVTRLLDLGLRAVPSAAVARNARRAAPPAAIQPRSVAIAALSHEEKVRAEDSDDEAKFGRPA